MSASTHPKMNGPLYLAMQKGIEGGFAPPTPTHRWIITRARGSANLMITYQEKMHGRPILEDKDTCTLQVADHADSIARVLTLLDGAPTQYPGAPDLYGRNTSIVLVTEDSRLRDLEMYGSAAGEGIPHPTEEQKANFNEAFDIISGWGKPT